MPLVDLETLQPTTLGPRLQQLAERLASLPEEQRRGISSCPAFVGFLGTHATQLGGCWAGGLQGIGIGMRRAGRCSLERLMQGSVPNFGCCLSLRKSKGTRASWLPEAQGRQVG